LIDKSDLAGIAIIGTLAAVSIGGVLAVIYGIVTVIKWAWSG